MFLTQTCKTANFISIIFILFLIADLVQSVCFFDWRSYTFCNPRLGKLFNLTLRKGFNRCMFIYDFKFLWKVESSSSTLFTYVLMMQLQSIVARSLLRLSGLKCERSRFLICFRLILSLVDVKIQNCEKWSLTSVMRLPLISTCSGLFTKMLSIKLAEFLWTRVGLSIVGRR